ncbi:MAG: DUF2914 domain-containing protein [Deltaproteobacteria bacterium]|nr:MAG: DUF2914 domain-containing protein [Deltaproteobacteria bacterium]
MNVRMVLVLALVGALGTGACGKKDETPPPETAAPETTAPETTAPPEVDTVVAAEPDTATAPEPDTAKAVEPDTATAPEPDTATAPEADTVEAAAPTEVDTVEAAEPDTATALEADTTEGGANVPDADEAAVVEPLIEITDSALAEVIEDRMPVARASSFSGVGTVIQAWIEAKSEIDTEVTITWRKEDKVSFEFQMRVGKSPHWRTWARKRVGKKDAGQWYADIRDANGTLLVSMPFTIEADPE